MDVNSINQITTNYDRPEPAASSSKKAGEQTGETSGTFEKQVAITKTELDSAVKYANEAGQLLNRKLNFTLDEKTQQIIVNVIDQESGEIVRQLPPKEMLRISAHLKNLRQMNDRVMSAVKSVILDVVS